MGSLFRSEEMSLCQLFVPTEAAYFCVSELGDLGVVQFNDLNSHVNAFQRRFVSEIRRCDEMERQIRFLETEMRKAGIVIPEVPGKPETPAPREIADLETNFDRLETEVKELNLNAESLKKNFLGLTEMKHVLEATQRFFTEWQHQQHTTSVSPADSSCRVSTVVMTTSDNNSDLATIELSLPDEALSLLSDSHKKTPQNLGFIAGVINRDRMSVFERVLWRACRGNVFIKQSEIPVTVEDPVTGDHVSKSVFVIIFQGDQLRLKVDKICQGFHATQYPCVDTDSERNKMSQDVSTKLNDLTLILKETEDHRQRTLLSVAQSLNVSVVKVQRIKAIYHVLNMFNVDVTQKCLLAECYCPVRDMSEIHSALLRAVELSGSGSPCVFNQIESKLAPPTFNRTNKFTGVFQSVVDSYGIASYREVNPAPFTIVSFPFLFSLMFGDAGHGVIMFAASLWMVVMERRLLLLKSNNEIWSILFGGRYVILLMSAFSIYSGLLYNDIFSKSVNIFGSAWYPHPFRYPRETVLVHHREFVLDATNNTDCSRNIYPFGMDPIWQLAENKISFLNSFKMKISVIVGVSQMFFGVILSLFNHCYFRDVVSICGEFIPQVIFLLCMFGYLIILIFYKWIAVNASMSGCAPSLLIGLINMYLYNYPTEPCSLTEFYTGQKLLQTCLVLILLVCVPWLLFVKPFVFWCRHKRTLKMSIDSVTCKDIEMAVNSVENTDVQQEQQQQQQQQYFELSEVFVHQCIHTIEYCLGCISHTASYLRLWALSLAHAELSEVLWKMVFHVGLTFQDYIGAAAVFIVFAPWACLTVAILLFMEALSAFLHTLRLHWVEFQSKFYKGEGYSFEPLTFNKLTVNGNTVPA